MSNELIQKVFVKMQTEFKQAQYLMLQGELIKAEAVYLEILDQEANYPPALHGLAELANEIDEHEVREALLRMAIEQIRDTDDRTKKGLVAIWLTELAEALIKQNRQDDAKQCIHESEQIIKENLIVH